ncbi:MAG: hypothetical protein OXE92_10855 [Bacteroidetes bacterium]|nr:hypothetical protein [Bacteroidota bacterium]
MNLFPCFHPHLLFKWYLGALFLLPLTACQTGEIPVTRFEDSPVIDSLLAIAPHSVVNTNIKPETWVATTRLGIPNDSLILGQPAYMMAIGDSVYISQFSPPHIFVVGADGYLSRKIGQLGKGPGEFTFIRGLQYNGSYGFVKDADRVQVFTEKFEYVHSFSSLDMLHQRFSVSSDYVFLQCPGNDPRENDWLVCARSTSPPYDWIPSIELLPVLDLPNQTGENGTLVTVSPEGDQIAIAYMGLPYIFVYNDQLRHLRTIRFEGEFVRDFKPVGLPGGIPSEGMELGTFGFTVTMKFINSHYLVSASQGGYYVFDLSENNREFARKIIFRPMNNTEERKNIAATDFLLHGDFLYVSSPAEEYVYGYDFNLTVAP